MKTGDRSQAGASMASDRILELLRELPEGGEGYHARNAATFEAIAREADRAGDFELAAEARTAAKRARSDERVPAETRDHPCYG